MSLNWLTSSLFAKPVPLLFLFKSVHALFFFRTRSLIDRCQIVTDICKKMFQVVCKQVLFLASYHEHRLHWFTLNSSILDETVHKLGLETVSIKYTI